MLKHLMSLVLVVALSGAAQALIFEDDFDDYWDAGGTVINYLGWYEGGPFSIGTWDGFISLPDAGGNTRTNLAYNFIDTFNYGWGETGEPEEYNGVLRFSTTGGGWEHTDNHGPFLYKMVEGNFRAEVEIVSRDYWYHHLGGVMARAPNPDGQGANENWVSTCHFPVWNVGNRGNDTVNGATNWIGATGYPTAPYLALERVGNTFTFEISWDSVVWTNLGSVVRDDLPLELQVGIYEANFAPDYIVSMDFDNFSIVPEPATIALLGLGGLVLLRRRK